MEEPEIGVVNIALTPEGRSDRVFGQLPEVLLGLQWHGAAVVRLPEGAVALAGNERCTFQALRVGTCAWGVQFHVEVESSTIPKWARVPEYDEALARTGSSAASLERAVETNLATMAEIARRLFLGIMASTVGLTLPS